MASQSALLSWDDMKIQGKTAAQIVDSRARAGAVAAVVAGPGVAAGARAGGGTRHQPQYRGGGVKAAGGRRHRVDAGAAGHGDPRSLRRGRAGRRLARYAADRSGQRQSPAGMAAGHGAGVRRPTVPAPALRRADGQSGPGDLWARLAGAGLSGLFDINVTHGAVDAIERLLVSHLVPGDKVAVENPCFLSSINTLRSAGMAAIGVAMDDEACCPGRWKPRWKRARGRC